MPSPPSPPPPAYDTLYKSIQDITSTAISSDDLARNNDALNQATQGKEFQADLLVEIRALVADGNAINKDLQRLSVLLKDSKPAAGEDLEKIRKEYQDSLLASRRHATVGKTVLDDFSGDLLTYIADPDEPASSKVTELSNSTSQMKTLSAEIAEEGKIYEQIVARLKEFSRELNVKTKGVTIKDEIIIDKMVEDISELDDEIKQLDEHVALPIAKWFGLSKGVFAALADGSPSAALDALAKCFSKMAKDVEGVYNKVLHVAKERRRLVALKRKKETALAVKRQEAADSGVISTVPGMINDLAKQVASFSRRTIKFTDIEHKVVSELDAFILYFKSGEKVTDPLIKSKIELVRNLAPNINAALTVYALGTDV